MLRVGEFGVATGGGVWVAAGVFESFYLVDWVALEGLGSGSGYCWD